MVLNYTLKNKNILCSLTYGNSLIKLSEHGILKRELEIYNELCKYFNKVYLLNFGEETDLDKDYDFEIINIKQNKNIVLNFIINITKVYWSKRKIKIHFIRTNQTYGSPYFIFLSIILNAKLIARMGHESFYFVSKFGMNRFKKIIFYFNNFFIYIFSKYIFVPNEDIEEYINKVFKISNKKIHIIENYISSEFFSSKIGNKNKSRGFLYIGRINNLKLNKKYLSLIKQLGITVDVYGKIEDQNILKDNSFLIYKGVIKNENIPSIMQKYKYFLLLSTIDQNPKAVLEAMKMGLLVISIKFFGSNFLKHKFNSLILNENNIKEISELISLDNIELKNKIIKNGINYTKDLSSKDNALKEVNILE